MASSMELQLILFFACSLFIKGTLAEVICETLPANLCSFAIASSGNRCLREKFKNDNGSLNYMCTTSELVVERFSGYIETNECVSSCGVDRGLVRISFDALRSPSFISRLCSPACYNNCPNIVDIYFNLAASGGVSLPALCEKHKSSPHRAMAELLSASANANTGADVNAPSPASVPASAPSRAPAPS